MSIFDTVKDDDIIKELGDLELSSMTPIDALNTLYRLQTKLRTAGSNDTEKTLWVRVFA